MELRVVLCVLKKLYMAIIFFQFSFQPVQELQAILQAGEGQLNQPRLHMRATYTL